MIAGNPAFRVYDVDPDTYEIMDARVFIGPGLHSYYAEDADGADSR